MIGKQVTDKKGLNLSCPLFILAYKVLKRDFATSEVASGK